MFNALVCVCVCMCVCVCICIYIYIYRERERDYSVIKGVLSYHSKNQPNCVILYCVYTFVSFSPDLDVCFSKSTPTKCETRMYVTDWIHNTLAIDFTPVDVYRLDS